MAEVTALFVAAGSSLWLVMPQVCTLLIGAAWGAGFVLAARDYRRNPPTDLLEDGGAPP